MQFTPTVDYKMKEELNLIKANIDNLTSLWKTASKPYGTYFSESEFSYGYVRNSEWPNRIWLNQGNDKEIITTLKNKISSVAVPLIFPFWDIYENDFNEALEHQGFIKFFEQIGMSLKIGKPQGIQSDLDISLVSNNSEAMLWALIFEKSFGYKIHYETIIKTKDVINYYLAYSQNEAIGTAISYRTNNIMGVHAIGIPPAWRRRGFAEQIMKLLIHLAEEEQVDYMALQASDMGKNLYLKLGFEEQFVIKNYKLLLP